jgi:hypothetical protein
MYDSSTGLIYRDGRYFDPLLGIWLALMPLIVVQSWKRRKKGRGWSWCSLLLLGICLTGVLTGCEDGGEGSPVPCTDWPTLKSLSANTEGHIAVSPGAEINQDPHFEWLHYGTAPPPEAAMNTYYDLPDRPGVIFQAEIEIPDPVADGELHFVQTIATQRIKRAGEEIYYLGGEPTEWYIDAPEGTNLYSTITPIVSEYKGETIQEYTIDSPASALAPPTNEGRSLQEVEIRERFEMHVVWMPRMYLEEWSLGKAEWWWYARAILDDNGDWNVVAYHSPNVEWSPHSPTEFHRPTQHAPQQDDWSISKPWQSELVLH